MRLVLTCEALECTQEMKPRMSTTSPDLLQSLMQQFVGEGGIDRCELQRKVLALFDENRDRLLSYVRAFDIPGHEAEEVVQEVFLALFRHLIAGKSRSNLRGWVFRVSHNLALKQRYANQRRQNWMVAQEVLNAPAVDPSPNPEEQAISSQRQMTMLSVLRALPEQDRLCVTLRSEGLSYREIAHALGISLGSVALSLSRSLARLMRAVET
jgi:RNA polymerase sigma-70 factor (ECF subfamily)